MNNNLSTSRRHPILFGILVMVVFFIVMNVSGMLLYRFGPEFLLESGDWVMQGVCECICAVVGIIMAAIFRVWLIWGERGRGFGKGLLTSMYFIVVSLYSLVVSLVLLADSSAGEVEIELPWKIAVFVATVFLIGFTEETFFRGIISNLFYEKHANDKAGVWTATIGSGFVFGLMHLGNCLSAIQPTETGEIFLNFSTIVGALVQTASACVMGMALTAIYYRCRNIWALAFVHGFIDLCGAFTSGVTKGGSLVGTISTYTPFMFVSMIPYVVLTIFLLRPKKMAEILAYRYSHYGKSEELPPAALDEACEPLTQEEGNAQESDKEYPYKKSERSMGIAVASAVAIIVALFALSVSLYMDMGEAGGHLIGNYDNAIFTYESTDSVDSVPTSFEKDLGSFEATETRKYMFTISSYPGDSKAYATFYVRDSEGTLIYADKYGGRCGMDFFLNLEEGQTYNITVFYDFSAVTEKMDYITKVTVQ